MALIATEKPEKAIATLGAWVRRETNGLRQTELTVLLRGTERNVNASQV